MKRNQERWGRLQTLTREQAQDLPIVTLPATDWDPVRVHAVAAILTDVLEDKLVRLSGYTIGDIHAAIGGLLPPHPNRREQARQFRTATGHILSPSRRQVLIHDVTLFGLVTLLKLLRGKRVRLPSKLTMMQRLALERAKAQGKDPKLVLAGLKGAAARYKREF